MKLRYLKILCIYMMIACSSHTQTLIPLFKVNGSYLDGDRLIVPKIQVIIDSNGILYHNGKQCFSPKDTYALCIYELFASKYIIISPIDSSLIDDPAIYSYPKQEIKIYSMASGNIYKLKINNYKLLKIREDEKEVIVKDEFNNEELIKMYLIKK